MWKRLFAFFIIWNLLSLVFGKMNAKTKYKFLSRRIDDLSSEARLNVSTMDERIKDVEANVNQLMSAIQQCSENSKPIVPGQEVVEDLKESINFQALALRKTMTKEKTLLREGVKQLNKNFYELRQHMQKQMSDFFETATKELLAANNSIEAALTEIKTINNVARNLSVDTRREMERFSSTLISESEDLRRGLEEVKRDMKAKGEDIGECPSLPCSYGRSCLDGLNMFTCACTPGYTGINCDANINECASLPCLYGGSCLDGLNMYTCACTPGYTGINCETDIDECASIPCLNGGSCLDSLNMYTCDCTPGYTGINCETNINECASLPCFYGGSCLDGFNMYTCACTPGYTGTNCETALSDCKAYREHGFTKDGVYTIYLWSTGTTIEVYCDMLTNGGGWTVMQNRYDGSVDFYRDLVSYENGFGNLTGEFWLGLKFVQEMVNQGPTELHLHVTGNDSTTFSRVFQNFSLGTDNLYVINFDEGVGSPVNTAHAFEYHRGMCFSTPDRDCEGKNCPGKVHASWWFNFCFYVNLNGPYMTPGVEALVPGEGYYGGITHLGFVGTFEALEASRLMFRRV